MKHLVLLIIAYLCISCNNNLNKYSKFKGTKDTIATRTKTAQNLYTAGDDGDHTDYVYEYYYQVKPSSTYSDSLKTYSIICMYRDCYFPFQLHYKIRYRIRHPAYSRLLVDKPVFIAGEPVRKTYGQIVSITNRNWCISDNNNRGCKIVSFSHGINNHSNTEIFKQFVSKRTLRKHPEIKQGAYFEAEYLNGHKSFRVYYLDRPIPKDSIHSRDSYYQKWNQQQDSLAWVNNTHTTTPILVNPHNAPHHKEIK